MPGVFFCMLYVVYALFPYIDNSTGILQTNEKKLDITGFNRYNIYRIRKNGFKLRICRVPGRFRRMRFQIACRRCRKDAADISA